MRNSLRLRLSGKQRSLTIHGTLFLSWGGASILCWALASRLISGPVMSPTPPPSVDSEPPSCVKTLEHRRMTLDDGSTIDLNANSCVAVLYSPTQRQIKLLAGEAIFRANPDRTRPFFVKIGSTSVVAIGTQFDVDAQSGHTRVLVMDGRVGLYRTPGDSLPSAGQTPVELEAGRLIDLPDDNEGPGLVRAVKPEDLARVTAWLDGKIVGSRIRDFLAEFPRYHNIEFSNTDPRLLDMAMVGKFSVNNLDYFLKSLETLYCIQAEEHPNGSGQRVITLTRMRGTAAKCR